MNNGFVAPGWSAVSDAFARNLELGLDDGASLCVYQHGAPVVDIWGGTDPLSGREWAEDSVTIGFSVTKGAATICLLQLVDSGLAGLDDPVAHHWPEFGANGKAAVSVRDVLTHLSALPVIELEDITGVTDWQLVTSTLASQPLQYPARTTYVYHALSFGFLVGELVRRISGLTFDEYFARNVAEPLGLDFWVGMPGQFDDRYLPSLTGPVEDPPRPAGSLSPECEAAWRSGAQLTPLFSRVDGVQGSELFNSARFHRAVLPAGSGITNARSLARLYASTIQAIDGVRLLSDEILDEAARNQIPFARVPDCGGPVAAPSVGLGFEVSHQPNPMLGAGSFGHTGMGGRLGFADRELGVSFGFVSQRMLYPEPGTLDPRWMPMIDAVRTAAS